MFACYVELYFDLLKVESSNALIPQFGVKEFEEFFFSLSAELKGCDFCYSDARTEEEGFPWKVL